MIRVAQTPAVNHNFAINFGHPQPRLPARLIWNSGQLDEVAALCLQKVFRRQANQIFLRAKLWANQRGILDRKVDRQGVRSVGTGVDNGISSKETLTANVEFGAGEEATVQFSG